jgi:phosphomannomutase
MKIAKMKIESGKTIDTLIESLEEPLESMEFRLNILESDFKAYGEKVLEDLREYSLKMSNWSVEPNNYEGIRVSFGKENGDGWFLLRMSLHDPLLPLNIESNSKGGVATIISQLLPFLKEYAKLDISSIKV